VTLCELAGAPREDAVLPDPFARRLSAWVGLLSEKGLEPGRFVERQYARAQTLYLVAWHLNVLGQEHYEEAGEPCARGQLSYECGQFLYECRLLPYEGRLLPYERGLLHCECRLLHGPKVGHPYE
jgi:hypothetical protein